jgi:hypothetical protein
VRTVWILGAGASKAAYCGMPLVKDFMAEAHHRLNLSGHQGEKLLDFIRQTYGYRELKDVNVEELLTFAWCDVSYLDRQGNSILQDPEKSRLLFRALDTRRKIEALIGAVLFQAQRECIQRGDRVHSVLANKIDGTQDTVVTYNYDLLIDDALWKAHKASSDDYGVVFDGSVDGSPGATVPEGYVREPKIQAAIGDGVPILKLHGSLNWLVPETPFTRDPRVFYLRRAIDVPVGREFWWSGFGHVALGDASNDFPLSGRLRPMIVPPTFVKDALSGSPMEKLWQKAKEALEKCDRVAIIGLSLREADYQTRWLLRTTLVAGHPRDIEIDIVNPSTEDRDRLCRFFQDLGRPVLYTSVDEFLEGRPI